MMRRRPNRSGLSIPIVVTLLAVVAMGLFAAAMFRQNMTRNLAALVGGARIQSIAEAAIREVAASRKLTEVFSDTGAREQLAQAFQGGTNQGGTLTPSRVAFEIPAQLMASAYAQEPGVSLAPVKVIPLSYQPDRRSQKGKLRFLSRVQADLSGRTLKSEVIWDYDFTLFASGEELVFLLARAPSLRSYQ